MSKIVNYFRETQVSILIRKTISKWPSYQSVPTGKADFVIKLKIRVLLSLISQVLRTSLTEWKIIFATRKIKGNYQSSEVLVIANGPTVLTLETAKLLHFKNQGGCIAVMNGYVYSTISEHLVPDFYFLMDPTTWSEKSSPGFREKLTSYIESNPSVTIVQPLNLPRIISEHEKYLFVSPFCVSGLVKSTNPFTAWGLASSTALVSLGCVKFMGFRRIYFAGLDGDSYRGFQINDFNQLYFGPDSHRFYQNDQSSDNTDSDLNSFFIPRDLLTSMADVLYAEAILRRDFNLVSNGDFINISGGDANDLGPRVCLI